MTVFSLSLGYYAFRTSEKQIVNKVSTTNQGAMKVVENNFASLQRTMNNWVTVFSIAPVIQNILEQMGARSLLWSRYCSAMRTRRLWIKMLVTGNFDYVALYGKSGLPLFQLATDDSSGAYSMESIEKSDIFHKTLELNGSSLWFPLTDENNTFLQNNRNEKIGMTRIIRDVKNGSNIGFIFAGVNKKTILNRYLNNMYDKDHGIVILDQNGISLRLRARSSTPKRTER